MGVEECEWTISEWILAEEDLIVGGMDFLILAWIPSSPPTARGRRRDPQGTLGEAEHITGHRVRLCCSTNPMILHHTTC